MPTPPTSERHEGRLADVAGLPVRRMLPRRTRRTIGAWCFLDHFGPVPAAGPPMQIGPHPHTGLQTVTWLLAGEVLHTDSLGSEQLIRPGELNLMTAGNGVAHAEEARSPSRSEKHGAQLWVAQPDATRHDSPAFEHHSELPDVDLGHLSAMVLVGEMGGAVSPARSDSRLIGAALDWRDDGSAVLPLEPSFEYGLIVFDGTVFDGTVSVEPEPLRPGTLIYLGRGRDKLELSAARSTRALLIGGEPFAEPLLMSWNFVARTRDEIDQARLDWMSGSDRFGPVASSLPRIPAPSS